MRDRNIFDLGQKARKNRRPPRALQKRKLLLAALIAVGGLGVGGFGATWLVADTEAASPDTVSGCRVTDGDTIRCGYERIRLLGIDAPELPGHCRRGRNCAPGDPYESTSSLRAAMGGTMGIERFGTDRYDRTLATVQGPRGDLSCYQLARGQAIYVAKWDNRMAVARMCPGAVL